MPPQWTIERKRDGKVLGTEEIRDFIAGYTLGAIPDYQMSALAMAIYFNGMTPRETADLTLAMMESGKVINPALSTFRKMVACHGGNLETGLPMAGNQIPLPVPKSGHVSKADADAIGRASLLLGAERAKTTAPIEPAPLILEEID